MISNYVIANEWLIPLKKPYYGRGYGITTRKWQAGMLYIRMTEHFIMLNAI